MTTARRAFLIEPPAQPLPAALAFLRQARFRLRADYLVKITEVPAVLPDEQIWWRPSWRGARVSLPRRTLSGEHLAMAPSIAYIKRALP